MRAFGFHFCRGIERLDVLARGLLSRVTGVTSRSRIGFPHAQVSLEREAALPVSSQSAPPSARVMGVHSRGGVSRVRVSQFADDEIRPRRGRRVRAYELFYRCEPDSDAQGPGLFCKRFTTHCWQSRTDQGRDFGHVCVQFVSSADIKNGFRQMRIPTWLHAFFALPAVLASEVGYTGKTVERKRFAPIL